MIYLDNAATTQVDDVVIDSMLPYFTKKFFNPGAIYSSGRDVMCAIERARAQVASLIGAEQNQVFFTSGGTEANNMVFQLASSKMPLFYEHGSAYVQKDKVLISAVEHDSVSGAAYAHSRSRVFVETIDVCEHGTIRKDALLDRLSKYDVGIVSVMAVNNETGSVNQVSEISRICSEYGAMFHTDCVQAVGSIHIDVNDIGCDFLSLSSHKIHGPKGVGALYIRNPSEFSIHDTLIAGGLHQEGGLRGGTENVPGIVGFGKACEILQSTFEEQIKHTSLIKQIFYTTLTQELDRLGILECMHINGEGVVRPGKILNIRFDGVDSETIVLLADSSGVCVSAGSACRSGESKPSKTLIAMGLEPEQARGSIRVSFSKTNTEDDAVMAAKIIASCVSRAL